MMQRRVLALLLCCAVLGSVQAARLRFNNDHGSVVTMLREATKQHNLDNENPQNNVHDNNEADSRGKDDSRAHLLKDFISMRDKFDSFSKKRDPERRCCLNSVLQYTYYSVGGASYGTNHVLQIDVGSVFFNFTLKRFAGFFYTQNEGDINSTSMGNVLMVYSDNTSTVDVYMFEPWNQTCMKQTFESSIPDPCSLLSDATYMHDDIFGTGNHSLPVQIWLLSPPGAIMSTFLSVEPTLCVPVTQLTFGIDGSGKGGVDVSAMYYTDFQLTAPPVAFQIPDYCNKTEMSNNIQPQRRLPSFVRQIIGI